MSLDTPREEDHPVEEGKGRRAWALEELPELFALELLAGWG